MIPLAAAACRHLRGPPQRPPSLPRLSRTRPGMRMRFCSTPSITIESNQLRWIDTSSVRPPRPRSVAAPLTDSSLSKVIEGAHAANIDFAAYILCSQFDFDSTVSSIYHQPWNGIFSQIKISMRTHAHAAARARAFDCKMALSSCRGNLRPPRHVRSGLGFSGNPKSLREVGRPSLPSSH